MPLVLSNFTRYTPRILRRRKTFYRAKLLSLGDKRREMKSNGAGIQRKAKRSKIGTRLDRYIYKSAKGYKNPRYVELCAKADKIRN